MCGIAGIVDGRATGAARLERVQEMSCAMKHRGPDDRGHAIARASVPAVVLAHRRLAIIDPSAAGHQPMRDGDVWISFNGEIYNYRELRAELRSLGHTFRTDTDTEVVLKAYAQWGAKCLQHLRGMFAFGLWDDRIRTLLLARDHIGVKPLYYWHDAHSLVFASEVRALLASRLVPRQLNHRALHGYMAFGSVQDPQTLVQGVSSLQPGHMLIWTAERVKIDQYWSLPSPAHSPRLTVGEVEESMKAHLIDAVRSQLVGDVPVAAFLSGGIDSTAIVALMRLGGAQDIRTVSVVFDEPTYDERAFSRRAARAFGTEHHELILTSHDVARGLPDALAAYDQPSMDGLNTYFVSQVTRREGLSVALSGLGGDEVFGGYGGHARQLLAERANSVVRLLPRVPRELIAVGLSKLARTESLRRFADLLATKRHPYFLTRQVFNRAQINALLLPAFSNCRTSWEPERFDALERASHDTDAVTRTSAFELGTYMLSMLLRDADQMSMAHALEVRVPLLDHRLVEFVFSLPGRLRLDDTIPKPLLTEPLRTELPRECVYRAKQGFELPFEGWLRGALYDQMRDSFLQADSSNAEPFERAALAQTWNSFEGGRLRWSRVWSIFVLRDWLARHQLSHV
jgi:asparagine synthase (glutamine-hydrolysing)